MNLFLGLEGTLIDGVNNNLLAKNIAKIKLFIAQNEIKEAKIFSFGIFDSFQAFAFTPILTYLTDVLGINLEIIPKTEIMRIVLKDEAVVIDEFQFNLIFGKGMAFIHYAQNLNLTDAVLFDDAAKPCTLIGSQEICIIDINAI